MAKASGDVWLMQAQSDLDSAVRAFDEENASTYCHALAKYQQVVEKSIKGVVAALHDAGTLSRGPSYTHGLVDEINILKRLPHNPKKGSGKDLVSRIKRFLDIEIRNELKAISDLAPRKPASGELEPRNTEYPYQRPDGTWLAPADPNAFRREEVEDFRRTAGRTLDWAKEIVFWAKLVRRRG